MSKYKDTQYTELYVSCSLPKCQRSLFATLWCGVVSLRIEIGTYNIKKSYLWIIYAI